MFPGFDEMKEETADRPGTIFAANVRQNEKTARQKAAFSFKGE